MINNPQTFSLQAVKALSIPEHTTMQQVRNDSRNLHFPSFPNNIKSNIRGLLHFPAPRSWMMATKWLPYQKAAVKSPSSAGTMVMSLAEIPGKINIASTLLLGLDINVFIPCVCCYSWDKEKAAYKVLVDLSQLKHKKSSWVWQGKAAAVYQPGPWCSPCSVLGWVQREDNTATEEENKTRKVKRREWISGGTAHWMLSCIGSQILLVHGDWSLPALFWWKTKDLLRSENTLEVRKYSSFPWGFQPQQGGRSGFLNTKRRSNNVLSALVGKGWGEAPVTQQSCTE